MKKTTRYVVVAKHARVAILLASLWVGACDDPRERISEAGYLLSDELSGVPASVSVPNVDVKQVVNLGQLRVAVPAGCTVEAELSKWTTDQPRIDVKCPGLKAPVGLKFGPNEGLIGGAAACVLVAIERHLDNTGAFLGSFPSDLAFAKAAYATQPDSLKTATGASRARIAALLAAKSELIWPAKHVSTADIDVFYTDVLSSEDRCVVAEVYDAAGTYRGVLVLRGARDESELDLENVFLRLIAKSKFGEWGHSLDPE